MANSLVGWRAQFVFALCLPVAVLLGYMLADPTDFTSQMVIMLIVGVLSIPLLMYSYHALLILTWNSAFLPYFLPGQPFLWMLVAFIGFGFAVVNRLTNPDARFIAVPSVSTPLVLLFLVVLGTAFVRGGLGFRIFGSSQFGGRGYFYIVAAVVGYFALISQRVPRRRAHLFAAVFFLSGLTAFIPNLAYLAGQQFNFLFYFFPVTYALEQAMGDYNTAILQYGRVFGLTLGSIALYCWLLARYGLRGIFDLSRPVRLLLFISATLGCLFCGYRGYMVLFLLTIAAQLFAERLYSVRLFFVGGVCALLVGVLSFQHLEKLPLVFQRSIAFLPLRFSPVVQTSVDGSSEWRIQMWRDVLADLAQHRYEYLYKGKGYGIDPSELSLATYSSDRGIGAQHSWAMTSGAYHNGPLTLAIPFGIWGLAAFLWFAFASMKYLYRNFRWGDPGLKNLNTFLFAFFIARLVYYLLVYGNFYTDLFHFTGIIALSISINGVAPALGLAEEQPSVTESEEWVPAGAR